MRTVENPPYEVFAHVRGEGAPLNDADGWAGFAPPRGHPSRLVHRDEVVERVAELRATQTSAKDTLVKAADWGKIAKEFSRFVGVQSRHADPVDA